MTSDPFESVIFTLVKKNNKTIFRAVKTHDSHLVLKVFFHGQQIPNLLVVDFKERRLSGKAKFESASPELSCLFFTCNLYSHFFSFSLCCASNICLMVLQFRYKIVDVRLFQRGSTLGSCLDSSPHHLHCPPW